MEYNRQQKNEEKIIHDIGMLLPLHALGLLHSLLQQQRKQGLRFWRLLHTLQS